MKRATILQGAVVAVMVGLMMVLLGGGAARRETPQPRMDLRPATEQERRQADREQLREEMNRLWEQRQQQEAAR